MAQAEAELADPHKDVTALASLKSDQSAVEHCIYMDRKPWRKTLLKRPDEGQVNLAKVPLVVLCVHDEDSASIASHRQSI